MGQKIHPTGLRLGITQKHRSQWYADKRRYPELLKEDYEIRQYINKKLTNAGVSDVHIERKADQVELEIRTARPGVVVGHGGAGIEALRAGIQKRIKDADRPVLIKVVEVSQVNADAGLICDYITQQLERRVSFRRVVRQAVQRAQRAGVEGIKIQVSGRLNGAEIARTEWVREGRVPLHTLRANIDYAYRTAQTTYGILGVKTWVFKGEVIPGQENQLENTLTHPKRRPKVRRRKEYESLDGNTTTIKNSDREASLQRERPQSTAKQTRKERMSKIDTYLHYAFDALEKGFQPGISVYQKNGVHNLLPMIAHVSTDSWSPPSDIRDYEEVFRLNRIIGFIGSINTALTLNRETSVTYIEASRSSGERLENSLGDAPQIVESPPADPVNSVNASAVHETGEFGDKSIIALIDDGIDIFHEAFYTEREDNSLSTRIIAMWDQSGETTDFQFRYSPDHSRESCPFGRVYGRNEINGYLNLANGIDMDDVPAVLKNTNSVQTTSVGGHGTCVASIAAGKQFGGNPGGIAPQSGIVVVKISTTMAIHFAHHFALNFIADIQSEEGLPVVVNVSQGTNKGSHDGQSALEYVYEQFLDGGYKPGRVVVKSAGNEKKRGLHAKISIPNKRNVLTWYSYPALREEDVAQLWFDSANRLKVRLSHKETFTDWFSPDEWRAGIIFYNQNEVSIGYRLSNSSRKSTESCIDVIVSKANSTKGISSGQWSLEIISESLGGDKDLHAWFEINDNFVYFVENVDQEVTLTLPGTNKSLITVAAVSIEEESLYSPAESSSLGPTRDTVKDWENNPCIAAPGVRVLAACSGTRNQVCITNEGTSFAAPHVSGAIALVLSSKYKRLRENSSHPSEMFSASLIKKEIHQAVSEDNSRWSRDVGFGLLDAYKLYQHFLNM